MKKCEICASRDASIFITVSKHKGEKTTLCLCTTCAIQHGYVDPKTMAPTDKLPDIARLIANRTHLACPICGFTLHDFEATGHLGCPNCYKTFDHEIFHKEDQENHDDIIEEEHHHAVDHKASSTNVRNKKTAPAQSSAPTADVPPAEATYPVTIEYLERALKQAVEQEQYEQAARLRDQLRSMKTDIQ